MYRICPLKQERKPHKKLTLPGCSQNVNGKLAYMKERKIFSKENKHKKDQVFEKEKILTQNSARTEPSKKIVVKLITQKVPKGI